MHAIFEADDTDAELLIDASNAFNALNRATSLHNIRVLCPVIAAYVINTYRKSARLFIIGGKEIMSAEGTTQGDQVAMAPYALNVQPLITSLQAASSTKLTMPVELALYSKSRNGGMPSTALAQSLAIFPTPRNVGLSQSQIKRQA